MGAIILLAGALIFNTLTMTVLDKVREIAILRSMGYRRVDIIVIFLFQGFLIATFGSVLGAGAGALLTYLISQIPIKMRGFLYSRPFRRGLEPGALRIMRRSSPLSP